MAGWGEPGTSQLPPSGSLGSSPRLRGKGLRGWPGKGSFSCFGVRGPAPGVRTPWAPRGRPLLLLNLPLALESSTSVFELQLLPPYLGAVGEKSSAFLSERRSLISLLHVSQLGLIKMASPSRSSEPGRWSLDGTGRRRGGQGQPRSAFPWYLWVFHLFRDDFPQVLQLPRRFLVLAVEVPTYEMKMPTCGGWGRGDFGRRICICIYMRNRVMGPLMWTVNYGVLFGLSLELSGIEEPNVLMLVEV